MTTHENEDTRSWRYWRWRLFNLSYLLIYFFGWFLNTPDRYDVLAIVAGLTVFVPIYLHAFEQHTPRFIPHIAGMEILGWLLTPFAGIAGVFHVYASVQAAFQRPARRALWLIAALGAIYAGFGMLVGLPALYVVMNVLFGFLIGGACISAAESIERERRLRRSRELEKQRATLAERERIAHDLHDLLGHTLTMVAVKSELAGKLLTRDTEAAQREMNDVAHAARQALKEIRAAVYDMTATTVATEISLAREALEAAGVALEVVNESPEIPPPFGKALGLTIREATTNIVRHSQADSARIELGRQADRLHLCIADNGTGADAGHVAGAGLSGLSKRIAALGGSATIDSTHGMRIRVELPLDGLREPAA